MGEAIRRAKPTKRKHGTEVMKGSPLAFDSRRQEVVIRIPESTGLWENQDLTGSLASGC